MRFRGGLGYYEAPWTPPNYNRADYAPTGTGGSSSFNPGPVDYAGVPPIGRGGLSGLGDGDSYGPTQYEAGVYGPSLSEAGINSSSIPGPTYGPTLEQAGIKVTGEHGSLADSLGSLFSGTWFGLPRWAVLAVGGLVAAKLAKGGR